MVIQTGKKQIMSLALANASMILQNAISMPDNYIADTYGSEMDMLMVADGYINLAIKIQEKVDDLGEDAYVRVKHCSENTSTNTIHGKDIDGNEYAICGNCSAILEDGEWKANYCPDCGSKIDWE